MSADRPSPDDLARFQLALLEGLHRGEAAEDLRRALAASTADAGLRAWIERWEPDLVVLGSLLAQTWAVVDR